MAHSLTLVVATLCLCTQVAVAGCSCNYGTVDISSPQCICACYPDYLQPSCLYTATDVVPMGIWVNTSSSTFSSYVLTQTLTWALSIGSASDITFVYARGSSNNKTYARYKLRGDYAQQLLWDTLSSANWTIQARIESSWEEILSPSSSGAVDVDSTTVIYQSTDGRIVITISTVAWMVAAAVTTLIVTCIDNLFLHNTADEVAAIQHLMDEREQHRRLRHAQQQGQLFEARQPGSPGQHQATNPFHTKQDYDTYYYDPQ